MKILITGQFLKGSLEASYCDAFNANGCEVYRFNVSDYVNPLLLNRLANKFLNSYVQNILNKYFKKRIYEIRPELVFVIKGEFISPETLKELKKTKHLKIFNFNPDNPFNENKAASSDLIRNSIQYYDAYFIWGKFLIPALIKAGAKHVEYLPFAYDPELHYPLQVSEHEIKKYGNDIAFIGSWDKEREEFLESLTNFDLAIWGNGWQKLKWNSKLKSKWKKKDVIGEEFSKVCNSSKIVLNHIRAQNGNAHNMKTFEIPACNGFMLTKRTEEQGEFFEEGKEIACFSTPVELDAMIRKYVNNDSIRNQIKINARKKIQPHTYFERAKKILDLYENLKKSL